MEEQARSERTTMAWHFAVPSPIDALNGQKAALEQQLALVEDAQSRMSDWLKRRQQALETGLDAIQRMSACKDPAAAVAVCGEWVSGSLNRLYADMHNASDQVMRATEFWQRTSQAVFGNGGSSGGPAKTDGDTGATERNEPLPMRRGRRLAERSGE